MSSVVIAGNTSGSITLQAPAVSNSTVLTLPTTSATLITDSSGILNIGSGQLYKDTSGNVGIGTSSPTGKLSITQSTAGATALAVNGVAARQFIDYAGGGGSYFDGAQTYFRTFGGTNCAILSASTNSTLQLTSSTGYSLLSITSATGSSAYLDFAVNNVQTARLFSDSNSMLAFATGSAATERMRIDSAGNVGIGTSSPAQKLHVSSSVSGSQLQLTYPSVRNYTIGATSDYALAFRDADANTERMRIDSSGNVGIGTSSPAVKLEVKGGSNAEAKISTDSNAYAYLTLNTWALDRAQLRAEAANPGAGSGTGSGVLSFWTANNSALAERMRIDSSGNLLVGTTSVLGGTNKLCLLYDGATSGGLLTQTSTNITYTAAVFKNSSGTSVGSITCTSSATSFVPSSDIRLKTNIIPISNGIERVLKLNPVDYNWISDGSLDNGFIAQELLDLPEFKNRVIPIGKADDGSDLYGVDYMKFVSVLTAAIQELKAIIDTQQEQINSLLGK